MNALRKWKTGCFELKRGHVVLLGLVLVAAKLVLVSAQRVYLDPDGAMLDDMMMYNAAVSITEGQWLGDYTWLTLSKHSFFALWLALLHTLHIPFLLGGQLLWAAAALAGAVAFGPVLRNRLLTLGLFGVLLFSPSSTANPAPFAFVTRVYRDNIFPALCLLCIAGMVAFALRRKKPLRHTVWWLVLAGVALAACWLTREDGWWLLPFVVVAMVATALLILRDAQGRKWRRVVALLLPLVLLCGGILGWCGVNNAYYGRFIVSDFSTGEFADAYGAMTRVAHENWDPKVAVPHDVREKLYTHVPAFAQLEPLLEGDWLLGAYAGGEDYKSGGFYWALRVAAAECGYYETPQKAKQYFTHLAAEINRLCDEGVLPSDHARRSSVSPPIRMAYVGPVAAQGVGDFAYCATFRGCDARSLRSVAEYEAKIAPMEAFLYERAIVAAVENSDAPYYTPFEQAAYRVLDVIRWLYTVALPLSLLAALLWQVLEGRALVGLLRKRAKAPKRMLLWLVCMGLIGMALLRSFMIAFVTVSSFNIGTYVMYLASVHPLLLLYGFVGSVQLWRLWRVRRHWGKKPKKESS